MTEEIPVIDLENTPSQPDYYPVLNMVMKIINDIPYIRDIVYLKIQAMRYEIVDVS